VSLAEIAESLDGIDHCLGGRRQSGRSCLLQEARGIRIDIQASSSRLTGQLSLNFGPDFDSNRHLTLTLPQQIAFSQTGVSRESATEIASNPP
jgi:hypothetical protein